MVNAKEILAGEKAPAELGVRAVDDHTLEVRLNTPLPYFPSMTTYPTLYPAHRATIEGPRRGLDGARQPGVERRLRARGDGAERVPHAGAEPDVLGGGPGDRREGDRPRHQRREPGPHPLPRRGARPPGAAAPRAVPGAQGGAARRGDERPAPLLLLLRHQPHRERQPGPSRRPGAARAQPRHRSRRHRQPVAEGRPVAGLQLHPPEDRGLRDAGHPLREAHPGGAGRRRRSGCSPNPGPGT